MHNATEGERIIVHHEVRNIWSLVVCLAKTRVLAYERLFRSSATLIRDTRILCNVQAAHTTYHSYLPMDILTPSKVDLLLKIGFHL